MQLTTRCYKGGVAQGLRDLLGKSYRSPEVNLAGLLLRLQAHEVPTAKLLAFGQNRTGFGQWVSFLLTEKRSDTHSLREWLRQCFSAGRRTVLLQLGAALARIHRADCLLGDMSNWSIAEGKLFVGRFAGLCSARTGFSSEVKAMCRLLSDLCRPAEVVRFLKSYFRTSDQTTPWRVWRRQVWNRPIVDRVRSYS